MFLLHRSMLLLLPMFAVCFAASPFNFGTSVKRENAYGISTDGLSVTYRTSTNKSTEKDDAFDVLQWIGGGNITDTEVGRNGTDSTNNGTEVGTYNGTEFVGQVTSNSTSALSDNASSSPPSVGSCGVLCKKGAWLTGGFLGVGFILIVFVLLFLLFRRQTKRHTYIGG
uniref:Uncharacterized protein n=1 Tax=Globodera rostochiensis TaxID=31243 RepID=A0A914IAT8_GLORO